MFCYIALQGNKKGLYFFTVLVTRHIWLLCSASPDYKASRHVQVSHPENQLVSQQISCKCAS